MGANLIERPIAFLSVIEELCTGSGRLVAVAVAVAVGVGGWAVILPEPSDLGLLLAGVGVLSVDVELRGADGHAYAADRPVTPVGALARHASAQSNEPAGTPKYPSAAVWAPQ